MGSKEKLLGDIWRVTSELSGQTVLDLFSGSGVVSYMFKAQGRRVVSNDLMVVANVFAAAMVVNNKRRLDVEDLQYLTHGSATDRFVRNNFRDLYFSDRDNWFIDLVRSRISDLAVPKKALARAALIRACMKKRARGIFTYVGQRYDDGRRDVRMSLSRHFLEAAESVNNAIFDSGCTHRVLNGDALDVTVDADVVYIDPPYYSLFSDNDYVRRYHFVEGLARDWKGVKLQAHTKTKKFQSFRSAFSTLQGTMDALKAIFRRYATSSIIVSYSSNSLPDRKTIIRLMREHWKSVDVERVSHRYSFGNQGHKVGNENNSVSEYLFIGT